MKKMFLYLLLIISISTLVACGKDNTGKTITLNYAGTPSDKNFNMTLFESFKEDRKKQGDNNTYVINYLEIGPDKIDSTVLDWGSENAPDIYEAPSDKIGILYQKGALAKLGSKYVEFIETYMKGFGETLVYMNGGYYGYPYTGDNTYYLQYDKSVFSEEDVKSIETLLDKANEKGYKVSYKLQEAFWSAAVFFTYGADYKTEYDEDGNVVEITADFNSDKGLKAAKALYKIIKHPAWINGSGAPAPESKIKATISGTWDIAALKEFFGENYGCAVMPTVTIDDDTKNLGCFVGGKFFGVNPQVSKGNTERLQAAHELAMYLSGEKAQTERYEKYGIAPCHTEAMKNPSMTNNPNMIVLNEQSKFGHPQDAVPANFWVAAEKFTAGIVDGSVTLNNMQEAIDTLNKSIVNSSLEEKEENKS